MVLPSGVPELLVYNIWVLELLPCAGTFWVYGFLVSGSAWSLGGLLVYVVWSLGPSSYLDAFWICAFVVSGDDFD